MEKDTRQVIEEAYGQFQKQIAEGQELAPVGQLMYSLLVAVIELDNKITKLENDDTNKFTFYS